MSVCPIYHTTHREADVARGKLALLESLEAGTLDWSSRLEEILSRCLLCGACADVCANQVQATRIMLHYRQKRFDTKKQGEPRSALLRNAMEGDLGARTLLKGGALLQALMCRKIPETSGLHLRFPLSFFTQRRTAPSLAWTPFLDTWQPRRDTDPEKGPRIGFFVGCGANFLFPDSARALAGIVKRLGATLIVPEEQVCCGLPAYVSGNTKQVRELARKNVQAFEALDLDAVLTVCASCGSHLTALPSLLEDDPSLAGAAASLAGKHKDAMAFLVENLDIETYLKALMPGGDSGHVAERVAYHDPCHLRIGQGTTSAPRQLLAALPGVEFVEAPNAGRCCGHGGDFNLSHLSLSMKIVDRRIMDFEQAEANRIVTGCTGCLLQFAEGISRRGLEGKVGVCHPLVLVEKAIESCQIQARQKTDLQACQSQNTDSVQ
jgi:glycolate oxidase iron-sulfur subunit